METIGKSKILSFLAVHDEIQKTTNRAIRQDSGHFVADYLELAKKIAALQFKNPEHVLLFRGQGNDYKNKMRNSTLKPSLFRPQRGDSTIPDEPLLLRRFQSLTGAEQALIDIYQERQGPEVSLRLKRHRILRWSILQHYEICDTPLLDVTHSLRVAASFASDVNSNNAYIYVLGVPNISGSVTASAEAGIQIIRLSSACPPDAVRPHIQEGYLLGEYPDMPDFDQKRHYPAYEIDFGRRLIAKFKFNPQTFWDGDDFPKINLQALYPNADDPLFDMADQLKSQLNHRNN